MTLPSITWPAARVALSLTLALGAPLPAAAQAAGPTQADAPVPALQHESALRQYRPLGPAAPTPWRQANERVNQIGGWRAYAREAHAPTASPASPASSAPRAPSATKENGHAHH